MDDEPRPPVSRAARSSKLELAARIDDAEDMLCAGFAPGYVQRQLAKKYGVSVRQGEKYVAAVYRRWRHQTAEDAPFRREKVIRMAERFYAKALSDKKHGPAAQTLVLLARLSGAFAMHDLESQARVDALGPPPDDPTRALVWGQRCLVLVLDEVMRNPAVEPERKTRLVAELVAKLGMTHAKALVEAKLDAIEGRIYGAPERDADELEAWDGALPATARLGAGDPGREPPHRPGAPAAPPDDPGDLVGGGGKVGSD